MTRFRVSLLTYSALLTATLLQGIPAMAQVDMDQKPLVVIRFNQPRVYYERQLYDAMSQAVARKSDVMLDVVSNAPATGNPTLDARWVATASHNTQAVVASLERMGVPRARMHITGATDADLRFDETRIYVH
jgi:hypothetical protein